MEFFTVLIPRDTIELFLLLDLHHGLQHVIISFVTQRCCKENFQLVYYIAIYCFRAGPWHKSGLAQWELINPARSGRKQR